MTPDASSSVPDPHVRPTLTVVEGGRLLGLGRGAAYAAARRGDLPVVRIGRRLLVPTAAVRRLLQLDDPPRPAA